MNTRGRRGYSRLGGSGVKVGARHDGHCDPLSMVIGRRTDSQKRTIQVLEDML